MAKERPCALSLRERERERERESERERERQREGRCGASQLQQAENSGSSRSSGCRSLLFSQNVLLSSPANQRSRSPGDPLHAPFLQGNTNWRGRQTLSVCATELLSLLLLGFLFLPTEWILHDSGEPWDLGSGVQGQRSCVYGGYFYCSVESGPLAPKRQETGGRCTSGRQVYGYFHKYLDGCEWDVKVPDWLFVQSCIAIVL